MATNDTTQASLKSIFVISPIGKTDDKGFDFTNLFLQEIVKPAAEAAGGFKVPVRADEVRAPGSITAKVMRDIVNADVCVADLTHRNPNVMYEVAIAHAADKPVILLQQEEGGPPFDFTDERVIHYSTRADEANRAKKDLTEHLKNAHHEAEDEHLQKTMHPVRVIFRDLQTRADATEPEQAILERLDSITRAFKALEGVVLDRNATSFGAQEYITPIGRLKRQELLKDNSKQLLELSQQYLDRETHEGLLKYLTGDRVDTELVEMLHASFQRALHETQHGRKPDLTSVKMIAGGLNLL